jgi:hypothetical protein
MAILLCLNEFLAQSAKAQSAAKATEYRFCRPFYAQNVNVFFKYFKANPFQAVVGTWH